MRHSHLLSTCLLLLSLAATGCRIAPEPQPADDRSVVLADNLSNQQVTCFGEDMFGYVWIGTHRGANKYNGYQYLQYLHTEDSTSLTHNQTRQIFSDSKGCLWISTRHGMNQLSRQGVFTRIPVESRNQDILHIIEADNYRVFLNTGISICEYDSLPQRFVQRIQLPDSAYAALGLYIDKSNRLWTVGYTTIQCYSLADYQLIASYPIPGRAHCCHLRANGELWIGSGTQLTIFDTKSGGFITPPTFIRNHPVLSNAYITLVYPYNEVSILVNTHKNGLFLINLFTGQAIHQSENGFPFNVPDADITSLFVDSNKNLWIGTYDQGVSVCYSYAQRFNTNEYLRTQTEHKSVLSMATDKRQNLWIVTRMHGLLVWDKADQQVKDVDLQPFALGNAFYRERINAVSVDSHDNIWLQTDRRLIRCRYHAQRLLPEKSFQLNVSINILTEDANGTLWAAGGNQYLYYLYPGDSEFKNTQLYPPGLNFTNGLLSLSGNKLLVASFNQNLRLIDTETWKIDEISILPLLNGEVFVPVSLFEDGEGYIWIGTIGCGLFRYSPHTRVVEKIEGIACNEISSITEDVQGNLWIGTLYGLSRYDRTVNRFTMYDAGDGIGGNQFNERSVCHLADHSLVFGGTHGLTLFNPIDVSTRQMIPLYIEELKVHNRRVVPGAGGEIETAMVLNPPVNLAYDQNNIQLAYAALDYSKYPRAQYAYRLDGFDQGWVEAGDYRQAFYSNLPAGDYTFQVRIISNDHTVTEAMTEVPIHVRPAPWLSIPAFVLYAVIIGSILFLILNLFARIRANRKRTQQAIREKEQEQYINKMNMSFFSNISHEFRTPLTMISGPVATLCRDESIGAENKRLLYIVQRSVSRMLRLINQILDFNKLENDTLQLQVQHADIIVELNRMVEIFRVNAYEKGITLNTHGLEDSFTVWIDTDKLDKIMVNLLSNALKFVPTGGTIEVKFDVIHRSEAAQLRMLDNDDHERDYLKISIEDSGCGIPEDKLEDVFRRYYQLDSQSNLQKNWGTGIGLYYSRRLAELHHGYLFATNRDGGGSIFTLLLPTHEDIYTEKEKEAASPEQTYPLLKQEDLAEMDFATETAGETTKGTLLVVDDDSEVARYLRELLASAFNVVVRYDAESAWKTIEEVSPDLIVSDVLMPGTDGFTFCKRIKDNLSTCHIPVILLTAKVTVDDQVEGLNVGANAYVTKPFDPAYLVALIKSQLRNRDNARRLLSDTTQTDNLSEEILTTQDKAFMDSLYALMEHELSNPELNITRMTEVLRISRTKFYYKVKGLTGENPNIFFKTYKLNRAAELIHGGKYTMAEIADMTGFSTPSHFSASFKKKFGVSPKEY